MCKLFLEKVCSIIRSLKSQLNSINFIHIPAVKKLKKRTNLNLNYDF